LLLQIVCNRFAAFRAVGGPRQTGGESLNTLQIEHVSHRFGRLLAVDDVSLSVGEGEIVCLVGPSGCGKTTLLRIAAGLEPLQAGAVRIGDAIVDGDGRHVPPEHRRVGLVFQDYALFPHLSVRDNIAFGLGGLEAAERRTRVERALGRIELREYADSFPHQLSGGQQQRVALARAIVTRPRVVLLDEPFSGLDTRLRDLMRDNAARILRETGISTLMVTHDPEEAMYIADRIAVMSDGRLCQVATPTAIYTQPASVFVAGFFGEVNRLDGALRGDGVETAIGRLSGEIARKANEAAGARTNGAVEIVVRHEAMRLRAGDAAGFPVTVTAAHYLGRSSLVDIAAANRAHDGAVEMRARVPGRFLPRPGTVLALSIDGDGAFVYAREDGG
jgi:iron(III) transport system ATP-binding protein